MFFRWFICSSFQRGGNNNVQSKSFLTISEIVYRKSFNKLPKVVRFKSLFFLYQNLGYMVYRTVLQYYSGETDEDAYDMRKALSRDRDKKSMIPLSKGYVHMDELEY